MRIQPASFAFMLLLGLLASVLYSGIDMSLPALAATAAALGARPADAGFTMSVFMLSLATAPLVYGPVSERYGRRPVAVFGVTLFVVGSLACALAKSFAGAAGVPLQPRLRRGQYNVDVCDHTRPVRGG